MEVLEKGHSWHGNMKCQVSEKIHEGRMIHSWDSPSAVVSVSQVIN